MNVVCERCQTVYDFDDTLVSERGTTVKCTNCDFQFKIFRKSVEGSSSRASAWTLKRTDGATIAFDSLAVLQKWIIEGRVTQADLISHAGQGWKTLGSIPELESFFATAEMRNVGALSALPRRRTSNDQLAGATDAGSAAAAQNRPRSTLLSGTSSPPMFPVHDDGTAPAIARPDHSQGVDGSTPAEIVTTEAATTELNSWKRASLSTLLRRPESMQPPSSGKQVPAVPPPPSVQPGFVKSSRREAPNAEAPTLLSEETPTLLSNEEIVKIPVRQGGIAGALIGAGAGLLLALGGVTVAWRLGTFGLSQSVAGTDAAVGAPSAVPRDTIAELIARTRQSLRVASQAAYMKANEDLSAVLATVPGEPRLCAERASVLALLAERARQHAEEVGARAALLGGRDAVAVRDEAANSIREAGTLLIRAGQDVACADAGVVRVEGKNLLPFHLAMGEATRALGSPSVARRHLDAARAIENNPEVELLEALLERDVNQVEASMIHLRALAAKPATAVRARLALARLLATRGDLGGARVEITAVLRDHPNHDQAKAWSQTLASEPLAARAADLRAALAPVVNARPAVVSATSARTALATVLDAGAALVSGTNVRAASASVPDAGAAPSASHSVRLAMGSLPRGGGENTSGLFVPRSYDSLVAEGAHQQDRGQRERAREAYMEAIAVRPDGSEAISGLGFIELEAGNPSLAMSHFQRALRLNSRYSEVYVGMGRVYMQQHDLPAALRAFREYLEINPNGSRAVAVRSEIEQIERRIASTTFTSLPEASPGAGDGSENPQVSGDAVPGASSVNSGN